MNSEPIKYGVWDMKWWPETKMLSWDITSTARDLYGIPAWALAFRCFPGESGLTDGVPNETACAGFVMGIERFLNHLGRERGEKDVRKLEMKPPVLKDLANSVISSSLPDVFMRSATLISLKQYGRDAEKILFYLFGKTDANLLDSDRWSFLVWWTGCDQYYPEADAILNLLSNKEQGVEQDD